MTYSMYIHFAYQCTLLPRGEAPVVYQQQWGGVEVSPNSLDNWPLSYKVLIHVHQLRIEANRHISTTFTCTPRECVHALHTFNSFYNVYKTRHHPNPQCSSCTSYPSIVNLQVLYWGSPMVLEVDIPLHYI